MRRLFNICLGIILTGLLTSCGASFEKFLESGQYAKAEDVLKRMNENVSSEKYDFAEMLIREYIELEEYDKALDVHKNICTNKSIQKLLRQMCIEIGEYDQAWTLSDKEYTFGSLLDSGANAESYFRFMTDVILYLCSINDKAEANKFINHYSYWFYTRVDSSEYYSKEEPMFLYEVAKSKLQKIVNTY